MRNVTESNAAAAAKVERLVNLLRLDPGNESLRRDCVGQAMQAGRFDLAVVAAEIALARDASNAGALFDKSNALIGQREFSAALDVLKSVEELAGPDPAILTNQALCHYALGEFAHAKALAMQCYEREVRTPGLLRLLVSSCHHLGDLEEAVKVACANEEAATADAPLAGVYALLFLDADDVARASRWAGVTLRLNPQSVDGRVTQATLLTARMQVDAARSMYESVVDDVPGNARAWIGLGSLALLEQDLEGAKRLLARGVELMPTHVGSWHVLAWAQLVSGDIDQAERNFEHALQLDRNFSESHGGIASVAALRGQRERAERAVEIARRLDPECFSARFAAAVLADRSADGSHGRKMILNVAAAMGEKDKSALGKFLRQVSRH